jgi:hypothetical protein
MKMSDAMMIKSMAGGFLFLLCLLITPCFGNGTSEEEKLRFRANEAESMLYLFNQTTVSGGDVELIARLGAKLKQGLKAARELTAPDQTVVLPLNLEEMRYCLAIINRSTFPAKYAELVLGMKEKLAEASKRMDTETAAE